MADESPKDEPLLEITCDTCNGAGRRRSNDRWSIMETCSICNGLGYVPTEYGLAVLNLVRRHIDSMVREALAKIANPGD